MSKDNRIPVTREFDDKNHVGWLELTPEFKKAWEQNLIDSGHRSKNILVLSPAYIAPFPDSNGVIRGEAELVEVSAIPAYRVFQEEEKKMGVVLTPKQKEKIGQLVGQATACWENLEGAGVFQSEKAGTILEEIYKVVEE